MTSVIKMQRQIDDLVLSLIAALSMAATAVILAGSLQPPRRTSIEREFQSALGGLGMGCQIDLARCSFQFDPRIANDGHPGLDSVPALSEVCPWHSAALFPAPSDVGDTEGE